MSISFLFFSLLLLLYSTTLFVALIKKKIKIILITTVTTTTTTKRKRLLKSRALNIYILINIALFIYINKKVFIIKNENIKFNYILYEVSQNFCYRVYNNYFRNFKIIIRIYKTQLYDVNIIKQAFLNN